MSFSSLKHHAYLWFYLEHDTYYVLDQPPFQEPVFTRTPVNIEIVKGGEIMDLATKIGKGAAMLALGTAVVVGVIANKANLDLGYAATTVGTTVAFVVLAVKWFKFR